MKVSILIIAQFRASIHESPIIGIARMASQADTSQYTVVSNRIVVEHTLIHVANAGKIAGDTRHTKIGRGNHSTVGDHVTVVEGRHSRIVLRNISPVDHVTVFEGTGRFSFGLTNRQG